MSDREKNLELLNRRILKFDKVMVIQLILGAILGISFGWLADDGFFGDSKYIVDGVAVAIIVFLIVETILIETGIIREYAHLIEKEEP